jgi:hypothetical protein
MLSVRIWRMREKHEFGVHHTTGQGRDFKADSGVAATRSHRSETDKHATAWEGNPTYPRRVGGFTAENGASAASAMGKGTGACAIEIGRKEHRRRSDKAHDVGVSPQEDRGRTAGEVGEGESREEKIGASACGTCCGEYAAGFRAWRPSLNAQR